MLVLFQIYMLHVNKTLEDFVEMIDVDKITYGRLSRSLGEIIYIPFKNYIAGTNLALEKEFIILIANYFIKFKSYGWDYDPERTDEYFVCGDNPEISGLTVFQPDYRGGQKIRISREVVSGLNGISVGWANQLVGDEMLLPQFKDWFLSKFKEAKIEKEKIKGARTTQ